MEYGSMRIQRLQSGRWLNWGIRFFLTAALTASQTAGGYAPFALGCIAAAGPGADGAAALLGGVTGALLFLDFQQVLALAAVGILILTAATAFRDTAFLCAIVWKMRGGAYPKSVWLWVCCCLYYTR